LNGYNQWGYEDVVPDEETAIKIADTIVEALSGFNSRLTYVHNVSFDDERNIWVVYYNPGAVASGPLYIHIRRDSGMVTGAVMGGRRITEEDE
jgi:hypothetical protein